MRRCFELVAGVLGLEMANFRILCYQCSNRYNDTKEYFNRLSDVQHGRTCIVCIKNYKFKNEVGIRTIKVVKQVMNNGSYYSIAQWEIPTLAWYNNYFVFNAKVGFPTEL